MLLDDLGDYLSTQGYGTVCSSGDYGIFKGRAPEVPYRCIALFEYGGRPAVHTMSATPGQASPEQPRMQVMVRSPNYSSGRTKINNIFKALDHLSNVTINGCAYYYIEAVSSPIEQPRDKNENAIFVCNFQIMKSLST